MITTTPPDRDEAAEYFFTYINKVPPGDILQVLEKQMAETTGMLAGITEDRSLFRYAPDKWTVRQTVSHVNDTERMFVFRAFWFARGFTDALPGFNQDIAASASDADQRSWKSHIEEFQAVRGSTLAFFRTLPSDAWMRGGTAGGNPFTVHALAYISAGHLNHHIEILRERYLSQ